MSAKPYPATLRNWPTFRRILTATLLIDACIAVVVWLAFRATAI